MATDQPGQESVQTTRTLQDLTETTEQFIRLWASEMGRHSPHADRVEEYRQQCSGAIHLWSYLAIQMYRVPTKVERAGYDRLRTLVEDASRQARAQGHGQ
jgi:hypothetical protein